MSPEEKEGVVNVTNLFKIWTFTGVIICFFFVLYSLMGFIFQCTRTVAHAKIANCFLIIGYCLAMGWLVYGTVVRYETSGNVCTGVLHDFSGAKFDYDDSSTYNPYLIKTGSLIGTIVIILYVFYGCLCCCGLCACTAVACGYKRELS